MGQQHDWPHTGAFPRRGRRFRRGSVWIVVVILVAAAAAGGYFYLQSQKDQGAGGAVGISSLAEPVEETGPNRLELRFGSTVALRCDAQGGYKPYELNEPKLFRVEEEASTVHAFSWEKLEPGRFFYRVRVLRPGGDPVEGPLRNVLIPAARVAVTPGTEDGRPAGGEPAVGGPAVREGTQVAAGEGEEGEGTEGEEGVGERAARHEPAVPGAVGNELPASHLYDPPQRGAPKTKSDRFALMAYDIGFKYGGAAVTPKDRVELKKDLELRLGAFEGQKTAEGAVGIGRTYLLLHNEMMALKYFGKAEQLNSASVPALRGKLFVYEKYGMGWKVQETYGKLLALNPGSAALQKEAARAKRMYGSFSTFKETPKIITDPKYKDAVRERVPN